MISDTQLERAMEYLAQTDEPYAELRADVLRTEHLAKVAESLAFQLATGNVEERKAEARTTDTVRAAWEKHFAAVKAFELVRARRERAGLVVEVWRSENANRRHGQVS